MCMYQAADLSLRKGGAYYDPRTTAIDSLEPRLWGLWACKVSSDRTSNVLLSRPDPNGFGSSWFKDVPAAANESCGRAGETPSRMQPRLTTQSTRWSTSDNSYTFTLLPPTACRVCQPRPSLWMSKLPSAELKFQFALFQELFLSNSPICSAKELTFLCLRSMGDLKNSQVHQ